MKLQRMNLSVFWHQGWMRPEPRATAGALSRAAYYELTAKPRATQEGPLTSPWPPLKGQRFWESYLSSWWGLEAIGKDSAWRALVPLRTAAAPLRFTADADDTKVSTEGFLHPWGGTFVVKLELRGEWPDLPSAAERILELRGGRHFTLAEDGAEETRLFLLDDLAKPGLDVLRGLAAEAVPGPISPGFSVFALLDARGAPAEFDPTDEGTGAARFLHAVTSFRPTWEEDTLRPLARAKVAGRETAPKSHLVYGGSRTRAIWSPGAFTRTQQSRAQKPTGSGRRRAGKVGRRGESWSAISCHHRNLTLVSMQTEALSRLASETAARLAAGTPLDNEHDLLARCAVGRLGALYEGLEAVTYRSGSPRRQIEDGEFLAPINAVRLAREMPKIG